jgi:UDP-2-acetamido-2-deoxy-ribo-hexuluronate aminotransferase
MMIQKIDRSTIQMVDLKLQYQHIQEEIDHAVLEVIRSAQFINGPAVRAFQQHLEQYLDVKHVIPCANGTDALQIALMALDLKPGDEVIVPSFTYVATAEVIGLLQLKPVLVDVDPNTFNLTPEIFESAITPATKAVVPVHLFGQSADMEGIMKIARDHGIFVVEDNAQAIGADFIYSDGSKQKTGVIGHIGCTSFFPSKNLGCYGDGGAIFTQDDSLADKIRMIANHGQSRRYYHDLIGVNSRLDSIQAAILDIKLKQLDTYNKARQDAAGRYDSAFGGHPNLLIPARSKQSTHVFHQYTLRLIDKDRDQLVQAIQEESIPCMVYYPVPLYDQKAFSAWVPEDFTLPVTELLCKEVFSLPIHTELNAETQNEIIQVVLQCMEKI